MKKKVLFVITKSNWGGAQRYVFDLATNLSKEEFTTCVALGGSGEAYTSPGLLHAHLEHAGIPTLYVQSFARDISLGAEWSAFWELLRMFRTHKPDIVHLNSSKAGGLGALAARIARIPCIIFTAHGLPFEEDRPAYIRGVLFFATWITFLCATKVIVVSKKNYERTRNLLGCAAKIHLIHNGIPQLAFMSPEQAAQVLSMSKDDTLRIGTIAEYTHNKGLSYLIEALSVLTQEKLSVSLYLVGEGEDRHTLEKLAKQKNVAKQVHFSGFIPDAYQYLPAFDIVVLPSLKEGLPYVLLEAGQAAKAVVASDVGGVGDIIIDNVSGLLCTPGDTHDLAAKLSHLITHPEIRMQLGISLQHHVARDFPFHTMLSKTTALYTAGS